MQHLGGEGGGEGRVVKGGKPAHVIEGLQNSQAVPFIYPKEGIVQHQQLPTVHELASHSYPSLYSKREMVCSVAVAKVLHVTCCKDRLETALKLVLKCAGTERHMQMVLRLEVRI